jgi:hypothetical protein
MNSLLVDLPNISKLTRTGKIVIPAAAEFKQKLSEKSTVLRRLGGLGMTIYDYA